METVEECKEHHFSRELEAQLQPEKPLFNAMFQHHGQMDTCLSCSMPTRLGLTR